MEERGSLMSGVVRCPPKLHEAAPGQWALGPEIVLRFHTAAGVRNSKYN